MKRDKRTRNRWKRKWTSRGERKEGGKGATEKKEGKEGESSRKQKGKNVMQRDVVHT